MRAILVAAGLLSIAVLAGIPVEAEDVQTYRYVVGGGVAPSGPLPYYGGFHCTHGTVGVSGICSIPIAGTVTVSVADDVLGPHRFFWTSCAASGFADGTTTVTAGACDRISVFPEAGSVAGTITVA